jgi:hypothetical protein
MIVIARAARAGGKQSSPHPRRGEGWGEGGAWRNRHVPERGEISFASPTIISPVIASAAKQSSPVLSARWLAHRAQGPLWCRACAKLRRRIASGRGWG